MKILHNFLKAVIIILLFTINISFAKNEERILIEIARELCRSYEEKNIDKLMSFWSKKSPDYKKTKDDLKKVLKDFEDIKIKFSHTGSPSVVIKKNEATLVVNNRVNAKYIIKYPYTEEGDILNLTFRKNKEEMWKVVKIGVIKTKKKQQKSKSIQQKNKKILLKFKNKEEEKIFNLAKQVLNCISEADLKCFLKYNECSSFQDYLRCRIFYPLMFRRIKKLKKEEDIKMNLDESKKISISLKKDRASVLLPLITQGKYKLIFPFKLDQKMTVTFKRENGNWKVWKIVNVDTPVEEKKSGEKKK